MTIPSEYYRTIRRENSLVCYWRLNDPSGNTRAVDRAGKYNINGIYNGPPILDVPLISPVGGETGELYPGSRLFGGENQNVEAPNSSPLEITGDIAIEMWAILLYPSLSCSLFSKMNTAYTFPEPYRLSLESGKISFALGNGSTKTSIVSASAIAVLKPIHIIATSFRKSMKIFIDGIEIASGSLGSQSVADGGKPVYIGELGNNTSRFEGMIGEVALYNGALGSTKIKEHFSLGRQIIFQKPYYTNYDSPTYS